MYHGLFWGHVGQLSFVKRMSHITRFWTRFWGTPPLGRASKRGTPETCPKSSDMRHPFDKGKLPNMSPKQAMVHLRLHVLQCTTACFGDMLDSFPLSNRCLISLDFGHVSGVPLFEALPSGWLDIPNHFMKGRNDPFGSGLVVTLVDIVLLVCSHLH